MQQRPQVLVIAIAAVAVGVGALLLFALLNRGPDSGALTDRTWQLASITGETPAYQGVLSPEEQSRYTIAFGADGAFAARADCNTVAGTYQLSGSDGITITPGPSTLVACPDGSYGSLFAHALGNVVTWAIAGEELTLATSDGGKGTFVEASGTAVVATATASPVATASPTASASPSPSPTPSPSPSPTATPAATAAPTEAPTEAPTPAPTATAAPTEAPTPAPTATPAPTPPPTPAPTPTPNPGDDLVGTRWQLVSFTTRDPVSQGVVPVAERSKYTVSFQSGGPFSATADCNTVNGQWTATAGGGLTMTPGPSTIVACPEGSYGDLYVLALTNSASYAILDTGLTITLRDGGTLGYEPMP